MDYLNLFWKRQQYLAVFTLLCLINFSVISVFGLEQSRIVRLLSTLFFLTFYIHTARRRNKFVLVSLFLFLLKDIFIQRYEEDMGYLLYLLFGILAYAVIIIERLPKLKKIKFSTSIILISMLLVMANTYTLHTIMNMIDHNFGSPVQVVLFYMYGAFMILIAVTAVAYNNLYNSNRSLLFIFLVFSYVISDIASLFGYYFGVEFCYYIDRLAYLLGFVFFTNYGLNFRLLKEEARQLSLLENTGDVGEYAFAKAYSEEIELLDAKASLYTFIKYNQGDREN